MSEAAGGERLPTWETAEAYIKACGGDPQRWLERWNDAAETTRPAPSAPPTLVSASEAPPDEVDRPRGQRWPRQRLAFAGAAGLIAMVVAGVVGGAAFSRHTPQGNVSAGGATLVAVAPSTTPPALAVIDGADPKDSGCALDPDVVTLDSAEVDYQGLPAGLDELRYSPRCGVAWTRFEPFPKATIPVNALIHVDVVRPDSHNLRLPFSIRYSGAPVYGNVMVSTQDCVYAAATIEVAGKLLPESRTHCFRGRTPVLN